MGKSSPKTVWDDFRDHLERRDVVDPYWIDGKAGSGKSTLMKFIVDSPSTEDCLRKWATDEELIVIKFFFWNLGTALQKSSVGMLRALVLTVLKKHPELIPAVFPTLYQTCDDSDAKTEPSYIELKKAFALLTERSSAFVKLCIFVDGIDEFEGDHKDMSVFLRSLASAQVKVVVSSRPITACVSVFRECPTLKLQDLTKDDMRIFVQGNLSSHRSMVELSWRFPKEARAIEEKIQEKATGVFLWVKIVVRLLVDGLEAGDNLNDLQRKLKALPPDLRDLYQRMLGKMSREYQVQAAELFQLFHTWNSLIIDQPLPSLVLSFAVQSPSEVLYRDISTIAPDEVKWHCDNIGARIRSRCCGLIEIHKSFTQTSSTNEWSDKQSAGDNSQENAIVPIVDYLHRTVAEFLLTDDVWQQICDMTASSQFQCVSSMAYASLSMLKTTDSYQKSSLKERLHNALAFCRENEFSDQKLEEFFTQIDRTMEQHVLYAIERGWRKSTSFQAHWSTYFYPVPAVPAQNQQTLTRHGNRFCVAARLSLVQYLKVSGLSKFMNYFSRYVIVPHALQGWHDDDSNISLHDRSDTLLFLLQNVARPEDVGLDGSFWQHAVGIGDFLAKRDRQVHCAELLRVFLVTAHSRRALILMKLPEDGDRLRDPMTLIRNLKQSPSSSGYDGFITPADISFLGGELDRLSFSKVRTDDVSQTFLDIVAKVCSLQRAHRGQFGHSTGIGKTPYVPHGIMPPGQSSIHPSLSVAHTARAGQGGSGESWGQRGDYRTTTAALENLSLSGLDGPSFEATQLGMTAMNAPMSTFHAGQAMMPQYYTPTQIPNYSAYYHQPPIMSYAPTTRTQLLYSPQAPRNWPEPQYPPTSQHQFVHHPGPSNNWGFQAQNTYPSRFNGQYTRPNCPPRPWRP
jgi:hypothetical protein